MSFILTVSPLEEPISLAEAKLHLRVDHTDEDSLISSLIIASRQLVEDHINTAIIEQTWVWTFNKWSDVTKFDSAADNIKTSFTSSSGRYVSVPRGPIVSVTSIKTYDSNDTATAWDLSNTLILTGEKSIYLRLGASWPSVGREVGGVEITYKAGLATLAADAPATIRQAILQLVAYHYEQRGLEGDGQPAPIPAPALAMLAPFIVRKL